MPPESAPNPDLRPNTQPKPPPSPNPDPHPLIPEGINVSRTHPLADFGLMLAGFVGLLVLVILLAHLLGGVLVRFVPFATEAALLEELAPLGVVPATADQDRARHQAKTQSLQALADRLAVHMDLPPDMQVRIHYDPSESANAYATLGGNVVIYQGLLDRVSTENALSMVVAHEIAHIKNRDPLLSLGRGMTTALALAALSGFGATETASTIAHFTGLSLLTRYSRAQEEAADRAAAQALLAHYGHLGGADEFLANMRGLENGPLGRDFFRTHPLTDRRIERIAEFGRSHGPAELIALPPPLRKDP